MSGVAEVSPKYLADIATNGVPVGYKQTEVGEIPEDWKVTTVGKVVSITTGNKNTQDKVVDGLYPFFVRSQQVERINTYSFDGEGVLTAGDGVGTGKIFHHIDGKFDFHQRVYLMYNFGDELDGYYFYIYFSNNFYDRIMSMTAKSSVDSVRREMIADMLMVMPPKAEQTAIANALSDVDALISELEKLIAKKQAIKTATMQQLLTGRTRLPQFALREDGTPKATKPSELGEIPEDWELKTVFELAGCQKNLFDDGDWIEAEHITDKGIRLIQTGNIGVGCYIEKDAKKYIFEESFEKLKCKELWKGDLLICRLAEPAGRSCIFPDIGEDKVITSVDVTIFRPSPEVANREFYNQYFSSSDWFKSVLEQVGGTTHKRISRGALGRISVCYPNVEEQTAIATILSDMDAEIQALEQRLGKTRQIKQGMMQELLTGKTRLINPSKEVIHE
ncbi:restriction endonuclease subunit S [Vibrio cholerae]|uniref:restriction endonuclease subunit S n=1 Tax=Vibrio cholerae TaxID=666 RepID=UPI0010FCEB7E|nr:restriction endonuclease subunit S [Vibrio cholerae]TLE20408.1 restriction endonuclease subunit S [Vibrio cholerae]TLE31538.1 restriction endonuclease subunit S [Vibrio cholerae]HDV5286238.1 restriction endonuclease subunit S [Vibrio cholerae]HDV5436044.1 restriction endonuclease subunit S [Vibrio cholerae]HDV5627269.1 restriction endonuclease subunit S [Vibrio cholerae]